MSHRYQLSIPTAVIMAGAKVIARRSREACDFMYQHRPINAWEPHAFTSMASGHPPAPPDAHAIDELDSLTIRAMRAAAYRRRQPPEHYAKLSDDRRKQWADDIKVWAEQMLSAP